MPERVTGFTASGARRVASATKRIEGTPLTKRTRRSSTILPTGDGELLPLVRVLAAISGMPGMYDGAIFQNSGSAPFDPSTAAFAGLVEQYLGTLPAESDCVLWNLDEMQEGATTPPVGHDLIDEATETQRRAVALFKMPFPWIDDRPIYVIDKFADAC